MSFSFSRSDVRRAWLCTAVFFFLAHGFRFLAPNFSDDTLLIAQTGNTDWQISLGRFMQPAYWLIRGDIPVPSVVGFLAYFFLACAICVVCSLLGLTGRSSLLLCAALTGNATFAIANSSYLSWTDVYMLSFLCCALCVYVTAKYRFGFLGGALILFAGLGLYQSYLETAIVLFLLVLIRMTLEKQALRDVLVFGLKALFVLLAGLLLYAAVYFLSLRLTGIQAQSAYNGLASVGQYDDWGSMLRLLGETFLYPFLYLFQPESHLPHVVGALYLFLLAVSLFELVRAARRRCVGTPPRFIFLLIFALLLPLGLNAVYFISKGITYALTFYAFFLMAALPLMLLNYGEAKPCLRHAVLLAFAVIYGCSFVFSAQLYTLRELEFRSTLSLMTRVLNRVELTDGYVPGETPVVLAGNLYNSPLSFKRPGFESTFTHTTYVLTYESYYPPYLHQILGCRVALPDEAERERFANRADVRAMPVFPAEGSIQMLDDVLVVHLGRQALSE